MFFTSESYIDTTPNHPFYVDKLGWTLAKNLRAGDILVLSNGEFVVIEWIQHEILESPVKVYNFKVEDFHTYFVGESAVLVHNVCPPKTTGDHSKILKENMKKEGVVFEPGQAAAHMVASGGSKGHWSAAANSRQILGKYGINVDSAANGVPLAPKPHGSTHTKVFHETVYSRLSSTEQTMIDMLNNAGIQDNNVRNFFIKEALESELRNIGEEVFIGVF